MRAICIFILTVIFMFLVTCACFAREASVYVAWNPNTEPSITYRIWRGIELLGSTTETKLKVNLPTDQTSTITAQAVNQNGLVSLHSKPLVVTPLTIQTSTDLKVWIVKATSTVFITLESEGVKIPNQFYRIEHFKP